MQGQRRRAGASHAGSAAARARPAAARRRQTGVRERGSDGRRGGPRADPVLPGLPGQQPQGAPRGAPPHCLRCSVARCLRQPAGQHEGDASCDVRLRAPKTWRRPCLPWLGTRTQSEWGVCRGGLLRALMVLLGQKTTALAIIIQRAATREGAFAAAIAPCRRKVLLAAPIWGAPRPSSPGLVPQAAGCGSTSAGPRGRPGPAASAPRRAQVVAQGDGWFCEHDGQTYPAMVRRYVMQARVCDASGEGTLSVFDDQARVQPPCPWSGRRDAQGFTSLARLRPRQGALNT